MNIFFEGKLKKNWKFIVLLIVIFFSIAIKIYYILSIDNSERIFGYGVDIGYEIADNLFHDKGYYMEYISPLPLYSFRPPLYPFFLFFIFLLFGKNALIIRIIYVFINTLTAYFTYLIGKKVFNKEIAYIAAFIVLFYPPLVYFSGWHGPETLSTFLLTLSVYLVILTLEKYRLINLIFLGITMCLLFYCQSSLLGLPPFLVAYYVFKIKREKIKRILQILLIVFLFLSPWIIRNFIIYKKIIFTTGTGLAFYSANNPYVLKYGNGDYYYDSLVIDSGKMSELERDSYLFKKGIEFIKKYPSEYLKLVALRFWRLWRPYFGIVEETSWHLHRTHQIIMFLTDGPILLFFLIGLFFSLRNKKDLLLFYLIYFYFISFGILVRAKVRYRIVYAPITILIASFALWQIYKLITAQKDKKYDNEIHVC